MFDVIEIDGVTTGGGAAAVDSVEIPIGEVLMVEVLGNNLTAGANLVLQPVAYEEGGAESLGESIVNNAAIGATDGLGGGDVSYLYPRRLEEDVAGGALDLNANEAGDQQKSLPFFVGGHKLRATISAGGAAVAFRVRVLMRREDTRR